MATLVERLPLIASRLEELPQPQLRALYDSLQLAITYQPQTKAADLEVTIIVDDSPDQNSETSQVWSVHPALHNTNLLPLVDGPTLSLPVAHAKVRRDGYLSSSV